MSRNAAYALIGINDGTEPDVEANLGETQDQNQRVQELPMRRIPPNRTTSQSTRDDNQNETQDESDAVNDNITMTPQERLYNCARLGDTEGMNEILSHPDIEINLVNKEKMTALHLAAQKGRVEIVKQLLSKGANRYSRDKDKMLPLHHAARSGHLECVDVLIKGCSRNGHYFATKSTRPACEDCASNSEGFNIDDSDGEGNTALYYAVAGGRVDVVKLLNDNDANPNAKNKKGETPLLMAARLKSINCLDILFKNSKSNVSQIDDRGRNILHFAVTESSGVCLKYLLEKNHVQGLIDKCEGRTGTPLLYAIGCRSLVCTDMLLNAGASPSLAYNDIHPIHKAAGTGLNQTCGMLLAKDPSLIAVKNNKKQTPLHMAAKSRHIETVDLICKELRFQQLSLSDEDESGQTALHIAVKRSDEKVLKRLSEFSISFAKQDSRGFTALHFAAAMGKTKGCEILVKKAPSNLYRVNKSGFFPLDLAFQNMVKAPDTVIFLLEKTFSDDYRLLPKAQNSDYFDNIKLLKLRMRKYMEKAIAKDKKDVVDAIIASSVWSDTFSDGKNLQLENFKALIKSYPDLALKVLGNHIRSESQDQSTLDFTVLENCYYMDEGNNPFDEKGRLRANAKGFHEDPCSWADNHPVTHIIMNNETELLKHPVTQSWLKNKWHSYTRFLHSKLIFLQGIYLCALVCFMATSWNWVHIGKAYNITKEEFCEACKQRSQGSDSLISPVITNHTKIIAAFEKAVDPYVGFYYFVFVTWILKVICEIFYICKLKCVYWRYDNLPHFTIELTQLILTMVLLFAPFGLCYNGRVGVLQENLVWQCGIFALLCAWLHLISTINEALASEFLPITKDFLEILVKVAYFLVTFVTIFAFIFHLLLRDQDEFASVLQAVGSTLVWMLTDLGYSDFFVKQPLSYPILSNFVFFLFITTIGCLIVSLISKERTRKQGGKDLDNDYRRLVIYTRLIFRYDICFPSLRRRFAVITCKYNHKNTNLLESYLGTIENEETKDVQDDIKALSERMSKIETLLSDVDKQVTKIGLMLSEKSAPFPGQQNSTPSSPLP